MCTCRRRRYRCAPGGNLQPALGVRGPHGSGQAVVAVVGDPDPVRLVLVGDDGKDRAEDFFAGDAPRRVRVGEHGRSDVPAPIPARCTGAADHDLRALVLPDLNVALHPVLLPPGDQGPIWVAGSAGSPTVSPLTIATTAPTVSS